MQRVCYCMCKAWPPALDLSRDLCMVWRQKQTFLISFPFFPSTLSWSLCVTLEEFLLMPCKRRLKIFSVSPSDTNLKPQFSSSKLIFATRKFWPRKELFFTCYWKADNNNNNNLSTHYSIPTVYRAWKNKYSSEKDNIGLQ